MSQTDSPSAQGQKPRPVYASADFRKYPTEVITNDDGSVTTMTLCEELIGGRWEPFYSICGQA